MKVSRKLPYPLSLVFSVTLGAILPLAFAPLAIWPVAIIVPALLFVLLDTNIPAKRLFLHGWLFGSGYFGVGVYWTYNSLHDFGQAPPLVAFVIAALLVACMAVFPALALNAWHLSKRRFGDRAIWLLPLFWFAFEWFRGWFITGMPWLSLGYAFTESPLAGFAPVVGVYGISAISIFVSTALIKAFSRKQYIQLATALLVLAAGQMLQTIDWTEATGKSLKVTMVQGNIPQEIKWQYEQRQNIFNIYWRETSQHWDSDLIVWPETALPGRSERIAETILVSLAERFAQQGSSLLTGVIVSNEAKQRFYNSMLLLGENQGAYHKRHLVMFGEYYPMRWLLDFLRNWINIPYSDLSSGPDDQALMSIDGIKLGVSICFENVFSREIMRGLPGANLLVNTSNDAWFGDSLAPHQHLQIAQMRALETGRAMVRSTNTGISAFIDSHGKILQRSDQFKTQSMHQVIEARSGVTPFYYFEKMQLWLAVVTLLALVGIAYYRNSRL
ncbi:MAG: apolipoprotein N-acyltransferase [Gammaproteobacteria bacterium]|nr:apolipoprotein N-acyltransferase [Gammaproteobacteria bacterium]